MGVRHFVVTELVSIKHVLNTYNLVEDLVEEEQTRG